MIMLNEITARVEGKDRGRLDAAFCEGKNTDSHIQGHSGWGNSTRLLSARLWQWSSHLGLEELWYGQEKGVVNSQYCCHMKNDFQH